MAALRKGYRASIPQGWRTPSSTITDGHGGGSSWRDLLPRSRAVVYSLVILVQFCRLLLKDAPLLRKAALRVLPWGHLRSRGDVFLVELNDTLAAYIRAQVTACVLIGVVCTIGFLLIGVPYAVVLGITAGLLEFIPLAGPLTIGALAVTFPHSNLWGRRCSSSCSWVVLRGVQDYVVYPKIVGIGIHLNPLTIILAILCGAELGVWRESSRDSGGCGRDGRLRTIRIIERPRLRAGRHSPPAPLFREPRGRGSAVRLFR